MKIKHVTIFFHTKKNETEQKVGFLLDKRRLQESSG